MDSGSVPCYAALAAARLLIHAENDFSQVGQRIEAALRRLCTRHASGGRHELRPALTLQVDDLQGRRLRSIDDAGPLTDVPLPAGTYQVTALRGHFRRSYTMTLEPGASVELHLRFVEERP